MKRNAPTRNTSEPLSFLSLREVTRLIGVNRSTLLRWYVAGHFPRPRALGPSAGAGRRAFLRSEVEAWILSRPPAPAGPVEAAQ